MPYPLARAEQYLKDAEECRRLAEIAIEDELKTRYRSMAEYCTYLAEKERMIAEGRRN